STSAFARVWSRTVGRNSGQLATIPVTRVRELARLLVHDLKTVQPLGRRQGELLADKALVNRVCARTRRDHQLGAGGTQRTVQRGDPWIRVRPLQLRDRGLTYGKPPRELGLREPGASPGIG